MFRKETPEIFSDKNISKEFLKLEYTSYKICSKKEFDEESIKDKMYGLFLI